MITPYLTQATSPYLSKTNTGLGNALFQIFTSYGLSKTYNHDLNLINLLQLLVILKKMGLNHNETIYRNLTNRNFINSNMNNINVKEIREQCNLHSSYDINLINNIINDNSNSNFYLIGYLQSHVYFDKYYSEINELLKPDENSISNIKNKYSHLFNKENLNISCHIRNNWGCNIKYDENFLYLIDSLKFILKNTSNTNCININIFSDEIQIIKNKIKDMNIVNKIKEQFTLNINFFYFENNLDYIDLWCMSFCHHNILSNSTLSWWGAYLNQNSNKIVTYPDDILRLVGGTIYNEKKQLERRKEHYKENWIPINTTNVIHQ